MSAPAVLDPNYNENTISTIDQLQSVENDLYKELENSSITNDLAKQDQIKNKLTNISNTRINLLNNLTDMHTMKQNQVINNRSTLLNNLVSQGIIQTELDNLKSNLDTLESNKNDKLKMVQINTYYAKRYKAHSELMKQVFIICTVILLVVIIDKKGFLPNNVGPLAVIIILVIGIISITKKVLDLNKRDNLDFDRYRWRKPESRKYDSSGDFGEFLASEQQDTSVCEILGDINNKAKALGNTVADAANAVAKNQGTYSRGTEGFNILGKYSSPAPYSSYA